MFRPTGMPLNAGGKLGSVVEPAARTATTCYMKGFAENIRIETSTGNPWFHRRICFTSKNPLFFIRNPADAAGTERNYIAAGEYVNTYGPNRLAANMTIDTLQQTYLGQKGILFKGDEGVDWDDVITAPIDTARVDLKFDKTWVYKSGNERGILKDVKLWHPMNKNLTYDEDEFGLSQTSSSVSVYDKRGMGNYHVLDIFSQGSSGSTADRLSFRATSTMYWHEK